MIVSAMDSSKWYNLNPKKKYPALLSGIGAFILLLMTDIAAIVGIILALAGFVLGFRD